MPEHKVIALDRLQEGRGRVALAGTTRVAVFLIEGVYYATRNFCPHAGGSLGTGRVQGLIVTCPRHNWGFNVKTGACVTQKMYSLATFPTRAADGFLWVDVPDT